VIIIVAASLLGGGGGSGGYTIGKTPLLVNEIDGETKVVFANNKEIVFKDGYSNASANADMTVGALLLDDDVLYYVANGKSSKIASDFEGSFVVTAGGSVLYTEERWSESTKLSIYDGSKSTQIAKDCYNDDIAIVASPDGKAVLYAGDYDDGDFKMYLWTGGKAKEIGKNMEPVAVSNGGKYIYYIKYNKSGDPALYVSKGSGKDEVKLAGDFRSAYMNKDGTQLVFNSDGKVYISNKGGEKQTLMSKSKDNVYLNGFLLPNGTVRYGMSGTGVTMIGIGSFANTFCIDGEYSIYRINKKFETESILKNVSSPVLCADGKTIFYTKSDSVYKANGMASEVEGVKIADVDDLYRYAVGGNGDFIVYTNDDDELYYQKGTAKAKKISDDVEYGNFVISPESNSVFYVKDEKLLVSKNGGKGSAVKEIKGDVEEVQLYGNAVMVSSYDDADLGYRSVDGKKFVLVYEEE